MANLQRIEKLKMFLAADPHDVFTRYALALEYHGLGQSALAIETLLELLAQDANYIPAYQQSGQIYATLNKTGEAKEMYRRGIAAAAAQGDTHAQHEMQEELDVLGDE
jgi:thioredoxin-like negative regulator of GroEL